MDKVLKVVGLLSLGILATFYRLFVFTKVWALTVVSLGAPQIGLLQAWGISMVFTVFTPVDSRQDTTLKKVQDAVSGILTITIIWFIAYLVFG